AMRGPIMPRPNFPAAQHVELQVAPILHLSDGDSVALGWTSGGGDDAVACAHVRTCPRAAKIETGQYAGTFGRDSSLQRKRVAAKPPTKYRAQVQLRRRAESVVAPEVEEAARVVGRRADSQRSHLGHRRDLRDGSATVLDVGVQVPARPRIFRIGTRIEAQPSGSDVKESFVHHRAGAPRLAGVEQREWVAQVARRPTLRSVRRRETQIPRTIERDVS